MLLHNLPLNYVQSNIVSPLLTSWGREFHKPSVEIIGNFKILCIPDQRLNDSTKIEGYIISKENKEAIPLASAYVLYPTIGYQSNIQGYFEFQLASGTY